MCFTLWTNSVLSEFIATKNMVDDKATLFDVTRLTPELLLNGPNLYSLPEISVRM